MADTVVTQAPALRRPLSSARRADLPGWDVLLPWSSRVAGGLLAAAGLFAFHEPLWQMANIWYYDENWRHGLLIPLFAIYLLHVRRANLVNLHAKPSYLGPAIVLLSIGLYLLAVKYQIGMGKWWSVWPLVLGLIWTAGGFRLTWIAAVPLGFLLLALPWSTRLYFQVTGPLRIIASRICGSMMDALPNVTATVSGVAIEISKNGVYHTSLNVADACSGMHMLVSLVTLGAAVAFISPRPAWQRLVLILFSVPFAIIANIVRIFVMGLIHIYGDPEYTKGIFHTLIGLSSFPVALGLLMGLQWLLDNIVVEDGDLPAAGLTSASAAATHSTQPATGEASQIRWTAGPILCSVGLLTAFAVSWPIVKATMDIHLSKERIELLKPLDQLAHERGELYPFQLVRKHEIDAETVTTLGTTDYINWVFRDLRGNLGTQIDPGLMFFVTYYTGIRDSVPHVPEECYIAGGYQQMSSEVMQLHVPNAGLENDMLEARVLKFAQQRLGPGRVAYVIYFFNVNNYMFNDRLGVRVAVTHTTRHMFMSKVEMQITGDDTPEAFAAVKRQAETFLQSALPVLVHQHWPNVAEYEQRLEAQQTSTVQTAGVQ